MNSGIVLRALFIVYLNSFAINFDEYSFLISCEKFEEFYILFNFYYLQKSNFIQQSRLHSCLLDVIKVDWVLFKYYSVVKSSSNRPLRFDISIAFHKHCFVVTTASVTT